MLRDVYEIFSSIKNTSSKNDKIEIVKKHGDNIVFQEFLKFLYDDMITTGLSSKKINKDLKETDGNEPVVIFETPLAAMGYISEFNTGSDKDIHQIQVYIGKLEEPYRAFMTEVLTKSYKCGVTASSVNKALGKGFIPEFKVMLAHSYEKFSDTVNSDYYLKKKLDGHRTLAFISFYDNKVLDVKFRTRKWHEITELNEIRNEIIESFNSLPFMNGESIVLDGEITILDDTTNPEDVFQSTSKIVRKDGVKTGLKFQVFDYLLEREFWNGKSELLYMERRGVVEQIFDMILNNATYNVRVPVLYSGSDTTKIAEWSNKATELGWEGIMLNTSHGLYETKRTPHLLKVKKFFSCDGIVKDIYEGEGKYKGMLGGIYITFEDQVVKIGSGFTDLERTLYWSSSELIVGKVAEYQYFEKTENQKGGTDLRFATWKQNIREDKTEDDVNYE